MSKIVFIHGRDQQGENPKELKTKWVNSLNNGFVTAGIPVSDSDSSIYQIKEDEVAFPFYGDMLQKLVNDKRSILQNNYKSRYEGMTLSKNEIQFYTELFNELNPDNKIIIDLSDKQSLSPLTWEWFQGIIRNLDNHEKFANFILQQSVPDVYKYLTDNSISNQINFFVNQSFMIPQCVIVGHSLGSIIGYNLLDQSNVYNGKFITLGSPLGTNAIIKKIPNSSLSTLKLNNGWFNAYDERDVVALNPIILTEVINYNKVNNTPKSYHGIEGYLSDPAVAKAIHHGLTQCNNE